jgi:uncharacterized repeat protein (TIGR04042 family)
MPALRFRVRWPDETVTSCSSPSRVVADYFFAGQAYDLADFVARSRVALQLASERVARKYGFACSAAAEQLAEIERIARRFEDTPGACVVVEALDG